MPSDVGDTDDEVKLGDTSHFVDVDGSKSPAALGVLRGVIVVVGLVGLWEVVRLILRVDPLTMPSVASLWLKLMTRDINGDLFIFFLLKNMLVTGGGSVAGLCLGAFLGVVCGLLIAEKDLIRRSLLPLIVIAQTVPIVAIAPAVVLFFGVGTLSKAVVAAFLTFFPSAITTARGIQSVPGETIELMQTYNASSWAILIAVKLPYALPLIFVGLETSAAFSVVGAIVAELPFGSRNGLGVVILSSWQFYTIEPQSLYCTVLATCALGGIIVSFIRLAARLALGGRQNYF